VRQSLDFLSLAQAVAAVHRAVRRLGIGLTVHEDFDALKALVQSLPNRHPLAPAFDPGATESLPFFDRFWIKGVDGAGRCVHLQAAGLLDLGEETLGQHLDRSLACYAAARQSLDGTVSRAVLADVRNRSGLICYHGECWLDRDWRGFKQGNLSSHLPRLCLLLVLARWNPDLVWAITHSRHVESGLPSRSGYHHIQPRAFRWRGGGADGDEWIMWMDRGDVLLLMDLLAMEAEETVSPVSLPSQRAAARAAGAGPGSAA